MTSIEVDLPRTTMVIDTSQFHINDFNPFSRDDCLALAEYINEVFWVTPHDLTIRKR